jgi:hypothetical protein
MTSCRIPSSTIPICGAKMSLSADLVNAREHYLTAFVKAGVSENAYLDL